jgi:hypothetical protein
VKVEDATKPFMHLENDDMQSRLDSLPLVGGPYRVAPGTTLSRLRDELWAVESAGTRRQDEFAPMERVVVSAGELPTVLAPGNQRLGDIAGQIVTTESCSEQVLASLVREQVLLRAPGDVDAPEAQLASLASSGRSGVLVVAMGKPNYGRLAAALIQTVKAASPSVPVALAWSGDVLQALGDARPLVDHLIPIDAVLSEHAEHRDPFYVKLCADQLTPFEQTLFIDADSLIYPGVDLRKELWRYAGHDFVPTISLVWQPDALPPGATYMTFGSLEPLVRHFDLKRPVLQAHSYYFYFCSSARGKEVLACARDVYRTILASTLAVATGAERRSPLLADGLSLEGAGRGLDELAMGLATSMVGVEPYFERHQPMVESGLFPEGAPAAVESCYLGFTVTGYNPNWSAHYLATIKRHGLEHLGYELDKEAPAWLLALQRTGTQA